MPTKFQMHNQVAQIVLMDHLPLEVLCIVAYLDLIGKVKSSHTFNELKPNCQRQIRTNN